MANDRPSTRWLAAVIVAVLPLIFTASTARAAPLADTLTTMPPAKAVEALRQQGAANGEGVNDARFALGAAETLLAVERLGRGLYELGPRRDTLIQQLPFLRFPVPEHPNPRPVNDERVWQLWRTLVEDLATARQTLEAIDGDASLSLPIAAIAFDFDGDGKTGLKETLGDVLLALRIVNVRPAPNSEHFDVDFDAADVQWLIAYTHLLSGMAEFMLAHDPGELFTYAGHVLFRKVEGPYDFLEGQGGFNVQYESLVDAATFLHLLRLPVREPERLERSRQHFLHAVRHSRRSFDLLLKETDDGREWIPNPDQTGAFQVQVTRPIVDSWLAFLDDVEAVLEGRRLVPFWRESEERISTNRQRGVNLKRALTEPQPVLDVILWAQGTAAVPYLEDAGPDKPLASGDSVRRMRQVTNGNFFTFAVWFN